VEADILDPNPHAFDCSEFVQWVSGRNGISMPDDVAQQAIYLRRQGLTVPLHDAATTPGALLIVDKGPNGGAGRGNHIAISQGNGKTIEARGRKYGVGEFSIKGRGFNMGALIPMVNYIPAPLPPPPVGVVPMYSPSITLEPIAAHLQHPNGGTALLSENGAVYTFGCPYNGAMNGHPDWGNRKAAQLELRPGAAGTQQDPWYCIVSTNGEKYPSGPNSGGF
jgi:cell wall-associated NlpC family hydrolase